MSATELVTNTLEINHTNHMKKEVSGTSLIALMQEYLPEPGTLVLWQYQNILFGRWDGKELTLSDGSALVDEDVLEARLFNANKELHVIRRNGAYTGYLLDDTQGAEQDYVDSASRLWGQRLGAIHDGFVTLKDTKRFLTLTVPVTAESESYALVTRNYVTADETTGQAGYSDYRYVAIEAVEGGE